jgi:alkylated DNA nucleotide flippase Atl1
MASKKRRKTFREHLADSKDLPKVVDFCERLRRHHGGPGTMLIPSPLEVDGLMRRVRRGRVTTIKDLADALARRHRTTIGCPITTGIFAWIAAHAADEWEREGRRRITPWWRTLKTGGALNPKYPGGVEEQARRLRAEGHAVEPASGKHPPRVSGFEKRRAAL